MTPSSPPDLPRLIAEICAVLQDENAALDRLDIPTATSLVPRKLAATEALTTALASTPSPPAIAKAQLEALRSLSADNKRLLERAMAAQKRLLAIIAGAVPKAMNEAGPYGSSGRAISPKRMPAIAMSQRV